MTPDESNGSVTERRRDPVTGEWRMFAGHRQDRTFLPPAEGCPLCPTRPGQAPTEIPRARFDVAVFENRFPALLRSPPEPGVRGSALFQVGRSVGASEVVVYSDDHLAGLADMSVKRISRIIEVWTDRYTELGSRREVAYVFVFENRGVAVGVTLDHPHAQIYGYPDVPPRVRQKLDVAAAYMADNNACVHCDVITQEGSDGSRVIARNGDFVAFVPFAARFPFEVQLVGLRHTPDLAALTAPERLSLAGILRAVLRGYDRLFGFALPYVMAMHQAPTDGGAHRDISHLHLELTPLHRSAERLKYIAGSELGAGAFVNDTAPEDTARHLRQAVSGVDASPDAST